MHHDFDVTFYYISGPVPENEFACTVCDSSSSQPPDEIVICDKCSVGKSIILLLQTLIDTDSH